MFTADLLNAWGPSLVLAALWAIPVILFVIRRSRSLPSGASRILGALQWTLTLIAAGVSILWVRRW